MEIGVLTLNVEGYRRFFNPTLGGNNNNLKLLDNLISEYNPDVLLLQEDILQDIENIYPSDWVRVSVCESHDSSVPNPKKPRSYKPFCNSILVRPYNVVNVISSDQKDLIGNNTPLRCSATIDYKLQNKIIKISTLHLSGGRYEDSRYNEITYLRDDQIKMLIGSDIIAGDFNSNPNDNKIPKSHPVYKSLITDLEKQTFFNYFKSGHRPLLDNGYFPVKIDKNTDMYGGTPDAYYYNPDVLILLETHIINCLDYKTIKGDPLLTDHNGIYCKFRIK